MVFADLAAKLQQNRGFADARLAADERNAADDDAAAQYAVSSLMPVTMRLFSSVVLMFFSFWGVRLV